jgi:predicted metal-binding protein
MESKKDFMPIYQREKAFENQIQEDLKTLVEKSEALDGVSRAAVVPAADVIVDEKVRWKCQYPICFGYNSSPCCPPHTPPVDECRRVIHSFRYGVVVQMDVPVEDFTGEDWPSKCGRHFYVNNVHIGQIEAQANSMGYRQAVGFQAGPCILCGTLSREYMEEHDPSNNVPCAVLQGGTCRNFLKARPAMEAMAIDVIGTVQPLGWDLVYIGGKTNDPADIPCASTVGLVLVC